jgi:hypothetical protein
MKNRLVNKRELSGALQKKIKKNMNVTTQQERVLCNETQR